MVFGFTKQSGGHVEIESKEGQGTTVKLYLPYVRRATATVREETENIAKAQGETVLVVEDDPDLLTLATNLLRSLDLAYPVNAHDRYM